MVINKKKIIIALIAIAAIILIINIANDMEKTPTIETYLTKSGFTAENGSSLYYKQISEIDKEEFNNKKNNQINATYEILYFNINKNQLTKNKLSYEEDIFETFIPTYDYTTQELSYTYRVVYNNTNVIFEGTYNLKNSKFICENTYSYKFNIEAGEETICNKIKYDVEDFKEEAIALITDKELLKSLKENK